ncbi:MAG TPA: PepSY domain-containing protein [Burkholderiaceae bacterium]|nr:PepSY domain-containing protein [Burkholderiaceae bacterium]
MKLIRLSATLAALWLAAAGAAHATGDCPIRDAGPKADWQAKEALEKKLVGAGWKVRRIKVDGQCYEVYGTDTAGKRVEAYFHPKTLDAAKAS